MATAALASLFKFRHVLAGLLANPLKGLRQLAPPAVTALLQLISLVLKGQLKVPPPLLKKFDRVKNQSRLRDKFTDTSNFRRLIVRAKRDPLGFGLDVLKPVGRGLLKLVLRTLTWPGSS